MELFVVLYIFQYTFTYLDATDLLPPKNFTFPTFPTNTEIFEPFYMKGFLGLVNPSGGGEIFFPSERFQCAGQTSCCTCSQQCMKYRECCADYLWDPKKPIPMNAYKELLVNNSKMFKIPVCRESFPLATKMNGNSQYILMIDFCPDGAPPEVVKSCSNLDNRDDYEFNIPVYAEDDGYFYRNAFCARCHSIKNFIFTNITAECTSGPGGSNENFEPPIAYANETTTTTTTTTTTPPPINIKQTLGGCEFKVAYSSQYKLPRPCSLKNHPPKAFCPKSNQYFDLCNAFYGILGTYANYYCYLCTGKSPLDFPLDKCPRPDDKITGTFTWSLTISFSTKTNINIRNPYGPGIQQTLCDNNKLYNIVTQRCEDYTCAVGYIKVNNKCERKPVIVKVIELQAEEASFDRCLANSQQAKIIFKAPAIIKNSGKLEKYFQKILNVTENISFQKIFNSSQTAYFQLNLTATPTMLESLVKELKNKLSLIFNYTDNVLMTKYNPIVSEYYKFDGFRFFSNYRYCGIPNLLLLFQYNFTKTCDLILPSETFLNENLTQWMSFSRNGVFRHASTCNEFHLQSSCTLSVIRSNYTILKNSSALVSGKIFNISEYVPLVEGIGVCLPSNPHQPTTTKLRYDYDWQKPVNYAQAYIGMIGTIISLIAYVIVAFVHLYFRELRTIHGIIIASLACTLFFSDLLFIIGLFVEEEYVVCKTVGILLHWSLLVVELWLVVMAFDLLSKFGSTSLSIRHVSMKRYAAYSAFVFIIPTIFTTIVVILDETNTYDIGYGDDYICFIANLYPRIYFYIIPLALCVVVTISVFSRAVYFLTWQELESRDALKNSGRKNTNLINFAFKVALGLGIIETIGFIQIRKRNISEGEVIFNAFFAFLYTILRSFRGLILLWVYVLTKNKVRLLKRLLKKKDKAQSLSLQSYGTTTKSTKVSSSTSINKL